MCVHSNSFKMHMQNLALLKGEIDKPIIIIGDVKTLKFDLIIAMEKSNREEDSNSTVNHLALIDVYRTQFSQGLMEHLRWPHTEPGHNFQ